METTLDRSETLAKHLVGPVKRIATISVRMALNEYETGPDKERRIVSYTDDAYLLGIKACSYAQDERLPLDTGLLAQLALVDRIYRGCVDTQPVIEMGLGKNEFCDQNQVKKWVRGIAFYSSWIRDTMLKSQMDYPESRFLQQVKMADKTMKDRQFSVLAQKFAETYRATWLVGPGTFESDTDHSHMLGLVACSLAYAHQPELNVGKVAKFALIHDLVEVYASDTSTINADADTLNDKNRREAAALKQLQVEFWDYPWLVSDIKEYESLDTPEARFVKIVDKIMPSISHLRNGCRQLPLLGVKTPNDVDASVAKTTQRIQAFTYDQPIAVALRQAFIDEIKQTLAANNKTKVN